MKANHGGRLLLKIAAAAFVLLVCVALPGSTNDLVITAIEKVGDCVTLTWQSHASEFYTVYWTDEVTSPVFWRVAEVNVPSGGTTTSWSEGDCSQSMMEDSGFAALLGQPIDVLVAKFQDVTAPDFVFPPGHPNAPKSRPSTKFSEVLAGSQPGVDGGMALLSSSAAPSRFYRVARTAQTGFVDGWGSTLGASLESLASMGEAFAVSAGPLGDAGAHSLVVVNDGTVTAWG